MQLDIKITTSVQDILNLYEENDLLRAIPFNYDIKPDIPALNVYKSKIKSTIPVSITLTDESYQTLTTLSQKANAPLSLVFSFLIETKADCNRIHSRKVSRALKLYYHALTNDEETFKRILNEYADSIYYDDKVGLSEEHIAYFLTLTKKGQEIIDGIEKRTI